MKGSLLDGDFLQVLCVECQHGGIVAEALQASVVQFTDGAVYCHLNVISLVKLLLDLRHLLGKQAAIELLAFRVKQLREGEVAWRDAELFEHRTLVLVPSLDRLASSPSESSTEDHWSKLVINRSISGYIVRETHDLTTLHRPR